MDKHQKKQIKRYIAWGCLALLVALLSVMPLLANQQVEADGPQASILTTKLQQQEITTQIISGGQLASEGTEEITIPEAVKLTKYLVSNGDTVKKGDPIARVDKVSIMLALTEVQETLDYLSGQIAAVATEKESDRINAQTEGTVKAIYGKAGDNVRDVMLEHGSLAVLSLDGKMAVDVECDSDLTYGNAVSVMTATGKQVKGFVESNILGTLTVTIEDKDYAIGEAVTVSMEDGTELGGGELYIHNPWNASAYYGTIKKVTVKVGSKVSAGKQLFQLMVGDHSVNFQALTDQRQEYEELMQELFEMHSTGVLTAPCDGFVTGVDKDGTFLLAATGEQEWFFQPLSGNTQTDWTVMLLSDTPDNSDDSNPDNPNPDNPNPNPDPDPDPDNPGGETPPPSEETSVSITTPALPQGVIGQAYSATLQASYGISPVAGTWSAAGLPEGLSIDPATGTLSGTPTKEGNFVVSISFTCDEGSDAKSYALLIATPGMQMPGIQMPEMDLSGLLGGMMGGFGGMGGYSAAPAFEPYSLETVTVACVTSQEEMTLEIAVDEQDIAKLSIGQEATVTVEALTGQTFPAVITSISNTGTNAGGSSKFTAKLTLSKSGEMLPGMNASAYLPLQTQTITAIPVAALVEDGARTIVYTGYDEKEETLIDPVAVTTGVSDGEYVQILSGLTENDTVYYAYYDTLEYSKIPERGLGF